jgi:hypothetical protein
LLTVASVCRQSYGQTCGACSSRQCMTAQGP